MISNTIHPLVPWGIAGLVLFILILVCLFIFLKKKKSPKSKIKVDEQFIQALLQKYGGKDNIESVKVDNARLKITVLDLDVVDLPALKEDSQAGVFVTGNTIKTLFKFDSNLIKSSLEKIL